MIYWSRENIFGATNCDWIQQLDATNNHCWVHIIHWSYVVVVVVERQRAHENYYTSQLTGLTEKKQCNNSDNNSSSRKTYVTFRMFNFEWISFLKKKTSWMRTEKKSSKCLVCARLIQLNNLENVIFCSKTNSIIKSHAKCSLLNNLSVVIATFFPDIMLRYWYLAFDNVNFNWYFVNYEWQAQAGKYGQTEFSRISSRCM